jgi:hypothetical protein
MTEKPGDADSGGPAGKRIDAELESMKRKWTADINQVLSTKAGANEFTRRVNDLVSKCEQQLKRAICRRPVGLRLPHKGFLFRALQDVQIELIVSLWISDVSTPVSVEPCTVSRGEVLGLHYEPPHLTTTHCGLVAERYDELEILLVDEEMRKMGNYAGYFFNVSYLQLDRDFEWMEGVARVRDQGKFTAD